MPLAATVKLFISVLPPMNFSSNSSACLTRLRAYFIISSPFLVGTTPFEVRIKIAVPTLFSRSFMDLLRLGCPIYRFCAALVMEPVRATSTI